MRLRKVVNREDYLGTWRMALMRIIDPIEWYVRKTEQEDAYLPRQRRGQHAVRSTKYGPLQEPSSGRALTQRIESPPAMGSIPHPARAREGSEGHLELYLKRRDSLQREFAAFFEAKARELLARRQATIETTGGTVRAKLLRFRNGGVFEHEHTSQSGSRHGMARIERRQLANPVPIIIGYLVQSVLSLGTDARPVFRETQPG